MPIVNGYKTYIIGALSILVGVLKILGIEVQGFEDMSGGAMIEAGLLALTFRSAMKPS